MADAPILFLHLQRINGRRRALGPSLRCVARPACTARRHGLKLPEDAAQARGKRLAGQPCGRQGDAAAFGFHPGKNLGALGDQGPIGPTINDHEVGTVIEAVRDACAGLDAA